MGLTNRRRSGYREKGLLVGTWNVRTLFKIGALISILSQLKKYKLGITTLQERRWQGKDQWEDQESDGRMLCRRTHYRY
jgi:hypothetical protein